MNLRAISRTRARGADEATERTHDVAWEQPHSQRNESPAHVRSRAPVFRAGLSLWPTERGF